MSEKDYKKLNDYLNGVFLKLEIDDQFLLNNIEPLFEISNEFVSLVEKFHPLNDHLLEYPQQNHLTFEDVYLLAREIIESIDPNYLSYYDNLLKSGILDFDYENKYNNSTFHYNLNSGIRAINIKRKFNYLDVTVLIHEFMHYMNGRENKYSINRYLLTEFISIYFEEYSKKYLLNKGIPKEELFLNERIMHTLKEASAFNWYNLILLSYEKIGKIDQNTYLFLNENYTDELSKEDFEERCKKVLSKCEQKEKEYRTEIMYEKEFDENEFFERLVGLVNTHYRYIMGTVLAYSAHKSSSLEKMVYLCNHINDEEYKNMGIIAVLNTIGINLNNINVDVIKQQIIENETKQMKH